MISMVVIVVIVVVVVINHHYSRPTLFVHENTPPGESIYVYTPSYWHRLCVAIYEQT